jgi:release factor glutamine methyltransferase
MEPVYQPSDDSYLLSRHVERLAEGRVLDIGTGSGIQAVTAAQKLVVNYVLATDINPLSIDTAKRRAREAGVIYKMEFVVSNLFENVQGAFDWIIFNPPYLPSEGNLSDQTWSGGPKGAEVIECFLKGARDHLSLEGSILLVFSSETGMKPEGHGYYWEVLEEVAIFFEVLYCAKLNPF